MIARRAKANLRFTTATLEIKKKKRRRTASVSIEKSSFKNLLKLLEPPISVHPNA